MNPGSNLLFSPPLSQAEKLMAHARGAFSMEEEWEWDEVLAEEEWEEEEEGLEEEEEEGE